MKAWGRWLAGTTLVGAGVAWACFDSPSTGVHFNQVVDFGAPPPPLAISAWSEHPRRNVPGVAYADDSIEGVQESLDAAFGSEAIGSIEDTQRLYREALNKFVKVKSGWDIDGLAEKIEFIKERLEVLGLPNANLFMKAVPAPGHGSTDVSQLKRLVKDSAVSALARYRIAAEMKSSDRDVIASAYLDAAALPGPRREPALIMAARTLLDERGVPTSTQVARARTTLLTLLREFPNSRFRWNASGWLARCDLLAGSKVDAMVGYLRQYSEARGYEDRVASLSSLRRVFGKLSQADGVALRERILKDGALLQPYLDYRLYHGAPTAVAEDGMPAKPTKAWMKELGGLVAFANEVLAKQPTTVIQGATYARLAELSYNLGDYANAASNAKKSIALPSDRRDLATFVLAGSQKKLGVPAEATKTLDGFETKFAGSYLVNSALELRALLAEGRRDWFSALAIYRKLGYDQDIAYLLDIRIPTAQLGDKNDDQIKFAYGMRLLREAKFPVAKSVFASMPSETRKKIGHVGSTGYARDEKSAYDQIQDPVTTASDWERLSEAKNTPQGAYDLASYYYTHRNLLLYNANLWDGSREVFLSYFWNSAIATTDDENAVVSHHHEHECLYVARKQCLDVVKTHPDSDVAPLALYRAACASRRLATMNGWWRERDKKEDLWQSAIDLMTRVSARYPNHPLAKNAKKYADVFRSERKGESIASMFGAPDL